MSHPSDMLDFIQQMMARAEAKPPQQQVSPVRGGGGGDVARTLTDLQVLTLGSSGVWTLDYLRNNNFTQAQVDEMFSSGSSLSQKKRGNKHHKIAHCKFVLLFVLLDKSRFVFTMGL